MSHNLSQNRSFQFTLRGLPSDYLARLKKEASQRNSSLNQILLEKLNLDGGKKKEGACSSLLKFAGTWSFGRAREFDDKLKAQRKIDKDLW